MASYEKICPMCKGSGLVPMGKMSANMKTCPNCGGSGRC